MKSYGQYCPIARASEVFAERWTPIIIRNLDVGCRTFNEILSGAAGLSKALLSDRLRSLQRAGIIEAVPNPSGRGAIYLLTDSGRELADVVKVLGSWGARWMDMQLEHMDPVSVLWAKTKLWDPGAMPRDRIVLRFDISDHPKPLWILAGRTGAEVCAKNPGFPEDLVVTTDRETLTLWHSGHMSIEQAKRSGRFQLDGSSDLVKTFPRWIPLSAFAAEAASVR